MLQGSDYFILAANPETRHVVGYIPAINDGLLAAYILHLEVRSEYHGQGIGSALVQQILTVLKSYYMSNCSARG